MSAALILFTTKLVGVRHCQPHLQDIKDEGDGLPELSDHLALELQGEEQQARQLAEKYNLHYIRQVFMNPSVYHLHRPVSTNRRLRTPDLDLLQLISEEPGVRWVDQQASLIRDKRRLVLKRTFEDPPDDDVRLLKTRRRPTYHSIPADVRNSRSALDEMLKRSVEETNRRELHWNGRKYIDEWEQEEEEIEVNGYPTAGRQDSGGGLHERNLQRDLIRVPLSLNIGSSVDLARSRLGVSQAAHEHSLRSYVSDETVYPRENNIPSAMNADVTRRIGDRGGKQNESRLRLKLQNRGGGGKWESNLATTTFNDPYFKDQWYLHNTGQLGHKGPDLNVTWAWLRGFTGRGIHISILDDGIQTTNADIAANYARIGGVRIVDGTVTDIQEATAISRHIDKLDVLSASWGPTDNGAKVEGPGKLTKQAFLKGIEEGRRGRGVVYVWASGNGGLMGDNCNLDGYTSSIYTLSVSALTEKGISPFYGEPCSSTLASVFVGGDQFLEVAKERKRHNGKQLRVVVPELDGHCSESFQGTSAAAPLMAGIVALVLQANPNLTWRDVQHLVVATTTPSDEALKEEGWQTNARGKKFNLRQGFGAVDAGKMVEAATKWRNVGPQQTAILFMLHGFRNMQPNTWLNITEKLDLSRVPSEVRMTGVEHVVANVTIIHPQRSGLVIFIVSPSGTTSQLLTHRSSDKSTLGFTSWGFMSVHLWGEEPAGTWTVAIKDSSGKPGYLKKVELTRRIKLLNVKLYFYVICKGPPLRTPAVVYVTEGDDWWGWEESTTFLCAVCLTAGWCCVYGFGLSLPTPTPAQLPTETPGRLISNLYLKLSTGGSDDSSSNHVSPHTSPPRLPGHAGSE
ncbi:Proprotein convertase subtilisin/kexin type 6-like [Homarus americanus]|uniref:Proprotein convertase subtilisin/kexin type 6-like n=1 Tax=Homarus americanus TaxID=6706 RepID=A0A8J5MWD9_HOMAM|nr:Proprotein convertase subtilisin/kexin type 6-like [Homarus americanus]